MLLGAPSESHWSEPERFDKLYHKLRRTFHNKKMKLVRHSRPNRHELRLLDETLNVVHILPYPLSRNFLIRDGWVTLTISITKLYEHRRHQSVQPYELLSIAQYSLDPS